MRQYKFILSGGGTGGHIYPAIAIADELKSRFPSADFLFVGAQNKMEMQKVPQAGYPIVGLWISGLQRRLTLKNLMVPFKLLYSLFRSFIILKRFDADIVIGTGGFASGPLVYAAGLKSIPVIIQEQNSYPGITNRLLSKKANIICVAYPGLEAYFDPNKVIVTGNPVRQDIFDLGSVRNKALQHFNLDSTLQTLLVMGGSLGAKRINQLVEEKLEFFKNKNIQVIWQCGNLYYERYASNKDSWNVKVYPFINNMSYALAAADIIISRAGASSVSELCIVGKPVIFIPSPNVTADHQTKNAQSIANNNAALLIKESELDTQFEIQFTKLVSSEKLQRDLGDNIKSMGFKNASKSIVNEIEKLLLP